MKHHTRKNSDLARVYEDFEALIRKPSTPEALQMEKGDVEALIQKDGSAIFRKLLQAYRPPSKEKDAAL